jgi:glutathione S-transferase
VSQPIVFGARYSTYVRSVLLALAEKGVAYELQEVDVFRDGGAAPDYLARHPFGRIPAFEHDGFRLYETAAILRYVDEAFPGPALQPADPAGRARVTQIVGILDSYAYRPMVWDIFVERSRGTSEEGTPDEAKIAAAIPKSAICLRAIAELMGEASYLAGDALTLADLHFVPIFAYLRLTPEGRSLIGAAPAISRWWDAVSARPSVAATRFRPELS